MIWLTDIDTGVRLVGGTRNNTKMLERIWRDIPDTELLSDAGAPVRYRVAAYDANLEPQEPPIDALWSFADACQVCDAFRKAVPEKTWVVIDVFHPEEELMVYPPEVAP